MLDRFTDRARKAMSLAQAEARRFNHDCVGPEHILLGLIKAGGIGAGILEELRVDPRAVRLELEKRLKQGASPVAMGLLPQTPRGRKVVDHALEEAREFGLNYVGTQHLLLGVMRDGQGVAAQALGARGVLIDQVRESSKDADSAEDSTEEAASGSTTATAEDVRFGDHPLVVQYRQLRDQLVRQRDEAVKNARYEVATFHRDLAVAVEQVLERVYEYLEKNPRADYPPPPPPQTPQ